jgi:hypothetical protein
MFNHKNGYSVKLFFTGFLLIFSSVCKIEIFEQDFTRPSWTFTRGWGDINDLVASPK